MMAKNLVAPGQIALPSFDTRPICVWCGEPAHVLGQYSPLYDICVCKSCSLAEPFPVEVFEHSDKSTDKTHLRIKPDAPDDLRERRVMLEQALRVAAGRLAPDWYTRVTKVNISFRTLRNTFRGGHVDYDKMMQQARIQNANWQVQLPECKRCGCVHDRRYESGEQVDFFSHCQRCDDEMRVEALFRHRAIFGDDAVEAILDRLQAAHPQLFERGLLPDLWFSLAQLQ